MPKLSLSADALKFLQRVERKHAGQIALKVFSLGVEPFPPDAERLRGTNLELWRADIGEYRIVYDVTEDLVRVLVIGKRNDDEVYKEVERKRL